MQPPTPAFRRKMLAQAQSKFASVRAESGKTLCSLSTLRNRSMTFRSSSRLVNLLLLAGVVTRLWMWSVFTPSALKRQTFRLMCP